MHRAIFICLVIGGTIGWGSLASAQEFIPYYSFYNLQTRSVTAGVPRQVQGVTAPTTFGYNGSSAGNTAPAGLEGSYFNQKREEERERARVATSR